MNKINRHRSLYQGAGILVWLLSMVIAAHAVPTSANTKELKTGWQLASSWDVVQDGAAISAPSYDASKWLPIQAMPATVLEIMQEDGTVTLTNKSKVPAFFVRAEIASTAGADEILPILWSDNYVTLFAGESLTLQAQYHGQSQGAVVRIRGYNVGEREELLRDR